MDLETYQEIINRTKTDDESDYHGVFDENTLALILDAQWISVEDELPAHYANIEICYDGTDALLTKHRNKYCHGYRNTLGFYKESDGCKAVLIKHKMLAWRPHIPFPQEDIKIEVMTLAEYLKPTLPPL